MGRSEQKVDIKKISLTNIDHVICYLPRLRDIDDEGIFLPSEGVLCSESSYTALVDELMRAIDENNFVQPFDWAWQSRGANYYKDRNRLQSATLATCVKLLTLHVRKDRICANHFGGMVMD